MSDDIDEVVLSLSPGGVLPANPPPTGFDTYEDAVAALRASLAPGQTLLLHAEDCQFGISECNCEPIHLVADPD